MKYPYRIFVFFVLLILLLFSQRTFSQQHNEGLISMNTYYTGFKDSSDIPFSLARTESKFWYRDSSAIFEIKVTRGRGGSDVVTKYNYELVKYTFLDLRKMRCQDYLVLSDTAAPFCNYVLGRTDFLSGVNLWYTEDSTFNSVELINLSDTVINNVNYKRVCQVNSKTVPRSKNTYFLDCEKAPIAFNLSEGLSEIYSGCQVRIMEMNSNDEMTMGFSMEQVRSKLTEEENRIFDKWEANSKSTSLPLMKFNETIVECNPLPKDAIEQLGL